MGRKSGSALPPRVNGLRLRIERWRKERVKRSRMPEALWKSAVSLARTHGVSPIARGVGLDYGGLKRRVADLPPLPDRNGRGSIPHSGGFVELSTAELIEPPEARETVLELSDAEGAKLELRLRGREAVDVVGLAAAFWRRGR